MFHFWPWPYILDSTWTVSAGCRLVLLHIWRLLTPCVAHTINEWNHQIFSPGYTQTFTFHYGTHLVRTNPLLNTMSYLPPGPRPPSNAKYHLGLAYARIYLRVRMSNNWYWRVLGCAPVFHHDYDHEPRLVTSQNENYSSFVFFNTLFCLLDRCNPACQTPTNSWHARIPAPLYCLVYGGS